MSVFKGRVHKYGDDVNTDVIFPGKYTYTVDDPKEMAKHALEDLDPGFVGKVKPGDIIVGGRNWGCGSSREQAVTCLTECGVRAVIAKSFSRIYYRNAVNGGLLPIVCEGASDGIRDGDEVEVDTDRGVIRSGGTEWSFPPLPQEVQGILDAGGLIPYTKMKITRTKGS